MQSETILQINIVETLSLLARQHRFIFFSVPNEGALKMAGLGKMPTKIHPLIMTLKKMGLTPGVSDLVIVAEGGRFYGMEVKTEKGRLSESQVIFRDRCRELGIPYVVVRSVEEVVEQLRTWGIVRKK